MQTQVTTPDEFVQSARANGWSRKETKSRLYKSGEALWAEKDAILAELGFATTDEVARDQQAAAEAATAIKAAELAAAQAKAAEAAAERSRIEAEEKAAREAKRAAAKAAIADGAVIWCDAAENKVRRVVNGYGKIATFDNGGHRIGLVCGDYVTRAYNTQCPDQFAGECFAVLKAVEFAAECGLKSCTIRNDRIGGFEASTKRGYAGAKYLWVAKKIAAEHGIAVTFDQCTGAENRADRASRTEED